jgi:hypothetical protein
MSGRGRDDIRSEEDATRKIIHVADDEDVGFH